MKHRIAVDGLLSEFDGGEAVLLDLTRTRYHKLNETGAFLWATLEKAPATTDALVQALMERYAIDSEKAKRSVERFAAELAGMGLIESA